MVQTNYDHFVGRIMKIGLGIPEGSSMIETIGAGIYHIEEFRCPDGSSMTGDHVGPFRQGIILRRG